MKRALVVLGMAAMMAGCGLTEQKDEQVCVDILKQVVIDPETVQVNSVKRTEGAARLSDLEQLYAKRFKGDIPPATQMLLEMYAEKNEAITQTFISVDTTYSARLGKVRDNVLCRYLNYAGHTELISFTIQNKDVEQHQFLDLFMGREAPAGLDTSYKIR